MPRYLVLSMLPLGAVGGGERWTISAYEALKQKYPESELWDCVDIMNTTLGYRRLVTRANLRVAAKDLMLSSKFLEYADNFDGLWIHQYRHRRGIMGLLAALGEKRVYLTNHGSEPFEFFCHYSQAPAHQFLEVSRFSADRTARSGVDVRHIYGSLWKNEIEPITLAQVKQRDPHSWIMCGRIWIVKKFEIGIRAVPDTDSLKIVGDPSVHPEYYRSLKRLAHSKRVIFCGRKSDQERNELMSGARGLLVCSSQVVGGKFIEQAELFGIVVAEAVAKGILPIVSGIPPFREIMELMKLGRYVFEPDNPADARRKLRLVQDLNDEEYQKAVQAAQDAIGRNMVWDDIVERAGL